jgi:hypothetical protein
MSFGQGVLQGLDMYRDFSQQRRANERNDASIRIAREQQDIANYEQKQVEKGVNARETVAAIDGYLGGEGIGKEWRTRDWNRLQTEKPELIAKLANSLPGFTKFLDENGDNVQGEIVGFNKEKDGNTGETVYVPQVKRFDTEQVVPMTQGRSADPSDPIVTLSEDDFKEKLDGLWQVATANGGLENRNSYGATRERVLKAAEEKIIRDHETSSYIKAGVMQTVENDGSITPQARTEFADLVLGIDDPQELMKIAEAQGIDVSGLVAEGQAAADARIGATAPEGSLEKLLFEQGVTREVWENSDPEKRKLIVERLNEEQDWGAFKDKTIGRVMAQVEELVTFPFDQIANLGNSIAESKFGRRVGLSDLTDDPTPTRQNKAVSENEQEINRQKGMRSEEEVSSSFTTPAPFELTAENLQKAILDGTYQPTAEQQTEMLSFLNKQGIETMADFEQQILDNKLKDNDAKMVAFIAAMTHEGTTSEKDAVAQKMLNLIERGSQDTTQYQQASIDDAKSARRTSQYEAETARKQLRLDMRKYDDEAIPGVLEDAENLYNKVAKEAGLMDEEGNFTDDDFDATGDEARIMGREITKYMGLKGFKAMGPKSLEAHLAGMKASVGLYVQALANDDKNDFFSKENMLDFFRLDAVGAQAFDLRQLRVGSVKDGKAQSIAYVGPGGVVSQTVPLAEIQREHPQLARIVLTAAEANSKASK